MSKDIHPLDRKGLTMTSNLKRIVAAALVAGVAGSALAAGSSRENFSGFEPGMTYEQTQVDRALPNVKDPVIDQSGSAGATGGTEDYSGFERGMTYEQAQVDRALPNVKDPVVRRQ